MERPLIAYVDTSILLRLAHDEPNPLSEWPDIDAAITSSLTEIECARNLDRLRLVRSLPDAELNRRRDRISTILSTFCFVGLDRRVLGRAAQPFSAPLGTLDAIHLATALLYRDAEAPELVLATHDVQFATAARASGLPVIGFLQKTVRARR